MGFWSEPCFAVASRKKEVPPPKKEKKPLDNIEKMKLRTIADIEAFKSDHEAYVRSLHTQDLKLPKQGKPFAKLKQRQQVIDQQFEEFKRKGV